MECDSCGGKLEKFKYLEHQDLELFLNSEFVSPPKRGYKKWLNMLDGHDLVKTEFIRKDFGKITTKYYLRIVERKLRTGIKLKHLAKTFKFETGTISYGEDKKNSIFTSYKILPITVDDNEVIRNYCLAPDAFDIDKLNKLITEANKEKHAI